MAYKRKVTTQQEGVQGNDSEFGKLKMNAKSKKLMPIIFSLVMLVFVIAIFFSGEVKVPENIVMTILGIFCLVVGILQLMLITDTIKFYEYGVVESTFLNLRKKRIAYDDVEAIVEVKHRSFRKERHNPVVSMWKIVAKDHKKSITVDATSFIGISNILFSVRHDTKIKNIED